MDEKELRAHGVDPTVMAARSEEEAVGNRARSDVLDEDNFKKYSSYFFFYYVSACFRWKFCRFCNSKFS